jgi:hypothetical protein
MTIQEIYAAHYKDYCYFLGRDDYQPTKYHWAASEIFDLTTYDDELDELFVKKIIEVLKVIVKRRNFEYIKDENNYITYILVCQLLEKFNWIEWGTSIRGAWIETYHPNCKTHPVLQDNFDEYGVEEIPCSKENLIALIEFMEE